MASAVFADDGGWYVIHGEKECKHLPIQYTLTTVGFLFEGEMSKNLTEQKTPNSFVSNLTTAFFLTVFVT